MNAHFWIYLILLLFGTPYFLIGIIMFYRCRHRPSIRARMPFLSLMTASSLALKNVLVWIYYYVASLSSSENEYLEIYGCILNNSTLTIIEVLIFWPLAFRFHYIDKVSHMVVAFQR